MPCLSASVGAGPRACLTLGNHWGLPYVIVAGCQAGTGATRLSLRPVTAQGGRIAICGHRFRPQARFAGS